MRLLLNFHPDLVAALSQKWPNCLNNTSKQPRHIECEDTEKIGTLLDSIEDLIAQYIAEYDPSTSEDSALDLLDVWGCKNETKQDGRLLEQMAQVDEVFKDGDTLLAVGNLNGEAALKYLGPLESEKCPVTILTGFLGAGKTTLLNHILYEQTEQKFLVIENEFGQEAIDTEMIKKNNNVVQKAGMAEAIISLDNGCACCTIRSDLRAALVNTATWLKNQKAKGGRIDGILVETTGLADPRPIIRLFKSDRAMPQATRDTFRLDAIVTVVDAKNIKSRLELDIDGVNSESEAVQQIAMADTILLNKTDVVSFEEALSVKDLIRGINPIARIMPTVKSKMDLSNFGNSRAYDLLRLGEKGGNVLEAKDDDDDGFGHGDESNDHNDGPPLARGLTARAQSFALTTKGETSELRYKAFLINVSQIAAEKSSGVLLRSKGILAVRGMADKVAFQMVLDTYDEEVIGEWEEGQERICKAVFIGLGLNRHFFEKQFNKMILGGSNGRSRQSRESTSRKLSESQGAIGELHTISDLAMGQ